MSLEGRIIALRVERGLPALHGDKRHLDAGILQHVIGCSQFFQPEPGLLAGIAELVVRRQDNQDFHDGSPVGVRKNPWD
ncbi:hypothetical protein D9M70_616090 [compost metagenome]